MQKPPPPPDVKFDFNRELGQPEDEFFGMIAEADEETQQPLIQRISTRIQNFGPLGTVRKKLGQRAEERNQAAEIAELSEYQQRVGGKVATLDPELEEHMIRLPSNRDFEDFLAAEQQTNLFDVYQRTRNAQLRFASWGLWVAGLVMVALGYFKGMDYLTALTKPPRTDLLLMDLLGLEGAQALWSVLGFLAPLFLFLILSQALAELFAGILLRAISRGVPGVIGLVGIWVAFALIGTGSHLVAVAVALITWILISVAGSVLRVVGVR